MRFGNSGQAVKDLQLMLNKLGYFLVADGQFGAHTEAAVMKFQKDKGLLVDGICGPKTLAAIGVLSPPLPHAPLPPNSHSGLAKGFDVSHYQKLVNWSMAKASGYDFAFLKCSEGASIRDDVFQKNWSEIGRVGMIRGAYHFFRCAYDGMSQADFVLSIVGKQRPEDLPITCDFEVLDGVNPQTAVLRLIAFMDKIKSATGKTPILYTMPNMMSQIGHAAQLAAYPLWLAAPGHTLGNEAVPSPWAKITFLQTSFTGYVPGVQGADDTDIFNGTTDELKAFAMEGS